ncbi:PEP-CTERM sorting domain-containing protein [Armatimonas sp.]|uniref:PEP-CTERM sorting domain-containing protein n=1 Tax=Armatimonas sp. TaxID=1872638 RepID=UPI00374D3FB8
MTFVSRLLTAGSLLALITLAPSAHAQLFSLDDGTAELSVGVTGGGTLTWGNHFVTAGATNITSIQVAFGSPSFPVPAQNGLAVTIQLFSDPTNDANPSDAVLLTSTAGVIASEATNTFINYPITSTALASGAHFYAVATVTHLNGQFPAAQDTSSNSADSLAAVGSNFTTATTIGGLGLPGRWLVRAVGSASVAPEPGTLALLGIGCAMAGLVRRRKL